MSRRLLGRYADEFDVAMETNGGSED